MHPAAAVRSSTGMPASEEEAADREEAARAKISKPKRKNSADLMMSWLAKA